MRRLKEDTCNCINHHSGETSECYQLKKRTILKKITLNDNDSIVIRPKHSANYRATCPSTKNKAYSFDEQRSPITIKPITLSDIFVQIATENNYLTGIRRGVPSYLADFAGERKRTMRVSRRNLSAKPIGSRCVSNVSKKFHGCNSPFTVPACMPYKAGTLVHVVFHRTIVDGQLSLTGRYHSSPTFIFARNSLVGLSSGCACSPNKSRMARAPIQLLLILTIYQASCLLGGATADQEDGSNQLSYRLPTNAKPDTYDIHLEPDLKKFTFTGEAVISFTVLSDTKVLTLNAKNLTIDQKDVKIDDKPVEGIDFKPEQEFLIVNFKEVLKQNTKHELRVKYTGELNDQKRGFYRSRYFDKKGDVRYVAATHFEPTGARLAFPCFDEPAYKAIFTISLTYDKSYNAISNTPKDKETDDGGKRTTVFKKTPVMSSYLVAFVVSDYKAKEKGIYGVWTKPHAVDQAAYALDVGEKLLDLLGNYMGIPYTKYMDKMDQVSLKDFSAGAMENWGLVTYRETALLYEDGVTTTRNKQSITTIIAHEFAHQWFGDLVSPKWWKYIWLNEGFATYFEYFITHELNPEWRLNETFVVNAMQLNAFVADAARDVRPINHDANSPQEISRLFDSIAYQKAGSIIRMMSHILKPEVFKESLSTYLNTYWKRLSVHQISRFDGQQQSIRSNMLLHFELGNTDSNDLLLIMQNVSNAVFETAKFTEIMDNWLNKPGYPVVNVIRKNEKEYNISQERFTLDTELKNKLKANDTKWWVPLTYVKESKPNFDNTSPVAWLTGNDDTLTLNIAEKDQWVIFNTHQTGYYRVNYDEENWKLLTKYLTTKDYNKIPVINRAQLVDDALNMARTNRLNYTVALPLTLYLHQETDYVPWQTALTNLNFLRNMLRTSQHYHIFNLYITYIMKNLTENVGYEPKKDDADITKILRVNAMKTACRAEINKCISYAEKEFKEWFGNDSRNNLNYFFHFIPSSIQLPSSLFALFFPFAKLSYYNFFTTFVRYIRILSSLPLCLYRSRIFIFDCSIWISSSSCSLHLSLTFHSLFISPSILIHQSRQLCFTPFVLIKLSTIYYKYISHLVSILLNSYSTVLLELCLASSQIYRLPLSITVIFSTVKLDVDLKNNIVCTGVRNVNEKDWNATYTKLVASTSDEDERKSLVALLACAKSEDILRNHLTSTISQKDYPVTFDSVAQSIISEHQTGVNIVLEVLIDKYEEIQKLNNGASMIKSCVEAIASAITEEEQFTKMAKFLSLRVEEKPLHTALSKASANLAWLERNKKSIENWLVENEPIMSSASSLAFASILLVLSLFITLFYIDKHVRLYKNALNKSQIETAFQRTLIRDDYLVRLINYSFDTVKIDVSGLNIFSYHVKEVYNKKSETVTVINDFYCRYCIKYTYIKMDSNYILLPASCVNVIQYFIIYISNLITRCFL
ncbi:uncharacterized protein LOC143431161 [Xylocopa sonorina]|uniref:uncharacterized protein LOC143431161 n=1 Tax=Xylocopa sonorina TaxID=1818115 RepID=UPI00403AF7E0